ncbi:MAG: hypothetical protein WKF36_01330 [Candidatus Nitrosocosmicus sp.]
MNKLRLVKDFYGKYDGVIRFNKDIILAAIITAVLDVIIVSNASLIYHANYLLISLVSLIADFAIFNLTFIVLFFMDNKKRYQNPDGTKNKQKNKTRVHQAPDYSGFLRNSKIIYKIYFYIFGLCLYQN